MPHMPNYKCTPPKGGGGRTLYICLLVILAVIAVKVGSFIAEYLTWFLIGLGLLAGIAVGKLGYSVYRALQTRTWHGEPSVMSKHDVLESYRSALEGYETGSSWMLNQNRKHDAGYVVGEVVHDAQPSIEEGHRERVERLQARQKSTRRRSTRSGPQSDGESGWPEKRP